MLCETLPEGAAHQLQPTMLLLSQPGMCLLNSAVVLVWSIIVVVIKMAELNDQCHDQTESL